MVKTYITNTVLIDSKYRLAHILRGPSKIVPPRDDGVKDSDIWAVEFEPAIDEGKLDYKCVTILLIFELINVIFSFI